MNCGADSRYASKMDVFNVPLLMMEISIEFCGKLVSIDAKATKAAVYLKSTHTLGSVHFIEISMF